MLGPFLFGFEIQGYMTVNGKRVSKADVSAGDDDRSVIHVVTEVLFPLVQKYETVAHILATDGRFETLLSALDSTGLLNDLEKGTK